MKSKGVKKLARFIRGLLWIPILASVLSFFGFMGSNNSPKKADMHTGFTIAMILFGAIAIGMYMWAKSLDSKSEALAAAAVREAQNRNKREYDERERQYAHTELQRKQEELRQLLFRTSGMATQSIESVPRLLGDVRSSLDAAEQEFRRGAFSPFWAAIENATIRLGEFTLLLEKLNRFSTEYKSTQSELVKMTGEQSAPFPVRIQDVFPAEQGQVLSQRMDAIVSQAQTNYQFATIFEQRRTSSILLAGFANLGQAINGMTYRLTSELETVVRTIDSNSREANYLLENIQSRRRTFGYAGDY